MISATALNFRYPGQADMLLQDINIQLSAGRITGLMGPNGVGKTSLLHLFAGLVFPKTGTLRVCGYEPRRRQLPFLQQLYYLPERPQPFNTTLEGMQARFGGFYPYFDKQQYNRLLNEFGLLPKQNMRQLSTGQRKRALLAFALAANAPVLLLDEPTNGLDISGKAIFRHLLADYWREDRCIIISTHQVMDLDSLLDSLLILGNNELLLQAEISILSSKVEVVYFRQEPSAEEVLFAERHPRGWIGLKASKEAGIEQHIPLDLLYQSILHQPHFFTQSQNNNTHEILL